MSQPGREESRKASITVSSGSGTATLTPSWTKTKWIRLIPPQESATYTFDIKDGDGYLMIQRTAQLGTLSEQLEISLGIAATVNITSASPDGTYILKFDMH